MADVPGISGLVVAATELALAAADIRDEDAGTVAVIMRLARTIDALDDEGMTSSNRLDNVSIPTYLRYAESLGLTPGAREKSEKKGGDSGVSKLGKLRSIHAGSA